MASEKPTSKGQAWFCTTGLPSDVVIEVDDMTFHLHKFPLMSKSRKLHDLITELETKPGIRSSKIRQTSDEIEEDEDEEKDEEDVDVHEDNEQCHITLPDFPGGSEAFEAAAKYCYGVKIDLSSSTVSPLRCAGEYLQMTEEYSEGNLISKTELFLTQSVLKSFQESIKALRSCEEKSLLPSAEALKIVERCIDAIVNRASSADPSLFGWPVNIDGGAAASNLRVISSDLSWFEDLARLSFQMFKRLILAMKSRDLSPEIIESCLMYYANKYFPGLSRSGRKASLSITTTSVTTPEHEQRELLEFITANLPIQRNSRVSTGTRFLFGLLRTAYILNSSESCRAALEMKIGSQLEQATLDDLLIPSYSYLNETLYDVECVERILGYFLQGEDENNSSVRSTALMLVGKLIDGYLSEIASDANLKPEKFYQLAVALPEHARLFDDGLYRAVDVYLKAHPRLSEEEREKICGVLDCQKLTLEACTHAAQNERLPLRAVVQVLFFEQLQLRQAIAGTLLAADAPPGLGGGEEEEGGGVEDDEDDGVGGTGSGTWRSAVRENQLLRLDMDTMRTRVHQLERECSTMKKVIERIDKTGPQERSNVDGDGDGGGGGGWRNSLTRKFGCKFKTQVCDSHEPTVVESRKGRRTHRQR